VIRATGLASATGLSSNPWAATGWADALESMINADPRTRDSIWMGVSLALSCLSGPIDFLTNNGTLYLLATGAGAGTSWSLTPAIIEDLVETARHLAAASPGARMYPSPLLALDEIGNLSPLPSLPVLMVEGGGTSSAKDLQDLSALIGERDERTDTVSIGDYGSRSLQLSTRRFPVMPPEVIRILPFGTALVLFRSAPPLVTDLRPWTDRKEASQLRDQQGTGEAELRRA
jgi:type IV secretion system protein VirD4